MAISQSTSPTVHLAPTPASVNCKFAMHAKATTTANIRVLAMVEVSVIYSWLCTSDLFEEDCECWQRLSGFLCLGKWGAALQVATAKAQVCLNCGDNSMEMISLAFYA